MVDQHDLIDVPRDIEHPVPGPFDIFLAECASEPILGNLACR
jgi:hypothetical protein